MWLMSMLTFYERHLNASQTVYTEYFSACGIKKTNNNLSFPFDIRPRTGLTYIFCAYSLLVEFGISKTTISNIYSHFRVTNNIFICYENQKNQGFVCFYSKIVKCSVGMILFKICSLL